MNFKIKIKINIINRTNTEIKLKCKKILLYYQIMGK